MGAEGNGNGFAKNVEADQGAAPNWGLATHFSGKEFALSGINLFADLVVDSYDESHDLQVVGLGVGDATYETILCGELANLGFNPHLVATEMQWKTLNAIPSSDSILRVQSKSTQLPLSASEANDKPRLLVSRAFEHYLSERQFGQLFMEAARVLKPGEMYVAQISSGDGVMLGALAEILEAVAGKNLRYLTAEAYRTQVEGFMGKNGKPVFKVELVGYADAQPRGSVELARRYLNKRFLELNRDRIEAKSLNFEELETETVQMNNEEDELSKLVQAGRLDHDQAVAQLDKFIEDTKTFDLFREVVVETVADKLQASGVMETDDLKVTNKDGVKDVWINVRYPVFVLKRTRSVVI